LTHTTIFTCLGAVNLHQVCIFINYGWWLKFWIRRFTF